MKALQSTELSPNLSLHSLNISRYDFIAQAFPPELLQTIRFLRYSDTKRTASDTDFIAVRKCYEGLLNDDTGFLRYLHTLASNIAALKRADPVLDQEVVDTLSTEDNTLPPLERIKQKLLEKINLVLQGDPTESQRRYLSSIAETTVMYFGHTIEPHESQYRQVFSIRERTAKLFDSIKEIAGQDEDFEPVFLDAAFILLAKQQTRFLTTNPNQIFKNLRSSFEDQLSFTDKGWLELRTAAQENTRKLSFQGESLLSVLGTAASAGKSVVGPTIVPNQMRKLSRIMVDAVELFLSCQSEQLRTALLWEKHLKFADFQSRSSVPIVKLEAVTSKTYENLLNARSKVQSRLGELSESEVFVSWSTPARIAETLLLTDSQILTVHSPLPWSLQDKMANSESRKDLYRLCRNKFEGNPVPLLGMVRDGSELLEWELELLGVSADDLRIFHSKEDEVTIEFSLKDSYANGHRRIVYKCGGWEEHPAIQLMFSNWNFKEPPSLVLGANPRPPVAILVFGDQLSRVIDHYDNLTIADNISLYLSNRDEAIQAARQQLEKRQKGATAGLFQDQRPAKKLVASLPPEIQNQAVALLHRWKQFPDDGRYSEKYSDAFETASKGQMPSGEELNKLKRLPKQLAYLRRQNPTISAESLYKDLEDFVAQLLISRHKQFYQKFPSP